uniref:DUF1985 domain-containing protein n=1 Tax=Brassica oleracea var. oleracea TaxID=109376 RepID=A0A0D3BTP9_BRAOL
MVSQSNAAGSSGRRRRPNTPKAKPVSRSKKTKRYPVSESDADTTPSSMDSTAPTSPPVDAVDSKANVIASVASALKGSSAMDRLLCSQFSKLFQLPVARCPNSTKLIGSLLCRQLITIQKYELWFTFGHHPLLFSVDEFKEITGLNCGVFDVEDSETEVNEPGSMWKQLFDTTVGEIIVVQVLKMLENPYLADWKRVPLALIALVDGVLCFTNKTLKLTPKYIEMLSNLESFMNYPWGHPNTTNPTFRLNQEDKFEKTLCDHFGVPLPNIHNKGKRKRPNRKSRKINSTVPKPGQEMHSYPLRSADGLEGTIGNTQPGFSRETRENNENSTLLTPQFDQNATDQEPRTPNAVPDESQTPNPLTTLTIYRGLFFARSQSYVSPAKKDDTYNGEKAVDVKWDEANPHAYSSVKEVPAGEHPSSDPNPESAPDFASTRSEENVGPVSTNLSGQKMQAPVIEGGVPDLMAVQNPTSPVEEDENYESCKENISFDSQLQGKRPRAVEDMPHSETDEDDNYVESGGKRVPKKSRRFAECTPHMQG